MSISLVKRGSSISLIQLFDNTEILAIESDEMMHCLKISNLNPSPNWTSSITKSGIKPILKKFILDSILSQRCKTSKSEESHHPIPKGIISQLI